MRQKSITIVILSIVFIAGILGIRHIILGGAYPVAVAPRSIEEQITQAIISKRTLDNTTSSTTDDEQPPRIENVTYFEDKKWVVANIVPRGENSQETAVIMKRSSSGYALVLGPGTDFAVETINNLGIADEMYDYLRENGWVSAEGGNK